MLLRWIGKPTLKSFSLPGLFRSVRLRRLQVGVALHPLRLPVGVGDVEVPALRRLEVLRPVLRQCAKNQAAMVLYPNMRPAVVFKKHGVRRDGSGAGNDPNHADTSSRMTIIPRGELAIFSHNLSMVVSLRRKYSRRGGVGFGVRSPPSLIAFHASRSVSC